jgi:protein O-GlcNAc transferase
MIINEKLRKAMAVQESGNSVEAEKMYWDILRETPNDFIALYHIGVIRFNLGDFQIAADMVERALASHKNSAAYNTLGLALSSLGKTEMAIKAFKQAIAVDARNHEAYNNLAIMLFQKPDLAGVIEACRKAIQIKPDYFLSYYNMGVAQQQQSKPADAIESFKKAISFFPAFPEAHCNMGLALMALGRREEAVAAYRQAIIYRPDFPEAYNNLGQPLNELGRLEEASEIYRKAVDLRPTYTDTFVNLAHTLRQRGLLNEAIATCKEGLTHAPHNLKAQLELGNLRRLACDWSEADSDLRQLLAHVQDVEPFILLSVPATPAEQLFAARKWSAHIPRGKPYVHNRYEHTPKIRIGYLSCDFHMHATAFLMAELFERHDRSKFELIAYSYDRDDGSEIRKRLIKSFDSFVDIHATSDAEAAKKIYEDKINILVDLKGYTHGTRTGILVNRPAPIQVNYVGYPGSMGADFIDYVIGDPTVTPLKDQRFYHEKIVQMPNCYQPNDSKRQIAPQAPSRQDCGLPAQGFVFCCFNASYKISSRFFDVWMRLLKAVPGSMIWLIGMTSAVQDNLKKAAKSRGVDPARLVFAPPIHLQQHLARHKHADLFLDTLAYGAHTTASDALWAGLPLLTIMGETFAGRVGSSALRAVGLPELITNSMAEYEARALELATNPEKLTQLKQKLAQNLPTSALFDIKSYTRDLEEAYSRMWETYKTDKPIAPFTVGVPS